MLPCELQFAASAMQIVVVCSTLVCGGVAYALESNGSTLVHQFPLS